MSRVTGIHFRYTCILYLQYHSSKHTIDIEVTSMLIEHKQQQNIKFKAGLFPGYTHIVTDIVDLCSLTKFDIHKYFGEIRVVK